MRTMTSRKRVRAGIKHQQPDRVPVDFGSTFITGIHCNVVAELRDYSGLEKHLTRICEPCQMIGLVEEGELDAMGVDVVSIFPRYTIFGFSNENGKTWRCSSGLNARVSEHFKTYENAEGINISQNGDTTAPASGHIPKTGYFLDSIICQMLFGDDNLDSADNLEEFQLMSEEDLRYWRWEPDRLRGGDLAVVTHLNGTCLGDIAEWYMATAVNQEYGNEVVVCQTEIALKNLELLHGTVGEVLDVVVVCGTDSGKQESSLCSTGTFDQLWLPHYQQMNDWIHEQTPWKTFKHHCGAVEEFIPRFVDAGLDILNPVPCSARGMSEEILKERHGDRITFWGGGVNTRKTLPFGTPEEVRAEGLRRCEVFSPGGGSVFNAIHNIQARTPIQNLAAMVSALCELNEVK